MLHMFALLILIVNFAWMYAVEIFDVSIISICTNISSTGSGRPVETYKISQLLMVASCTVVQLQIFLQLVTVVLSSSVCICMSCE